jgi:hypothetical protein
MGWNERNAFAVCVQPAVDGAFGVDAVEADPDGDELAALGGATDCLRVEAEQLSELASLVVALDHPNQVPRSKAG